VLTYGFACGHKGTALQHKELLGMTSTGGPNEAYTQGEANEATQAVIGQGVKIWCDRIKPLTPKERVLAEI